jgi:precorrin-3B synthase
LLERGFPATGAAAVPGVVRRDDGGVALVVAPLLGELTAEQVRLLADAAGTPGGPRADSGSVTGAAGCPLVVTPWRTVVLPDPRVPAAALAAAGLVVAPRPAADVSACAGRPGCAKALADVRADVRAALARVPGGLPAGRTHVSGCARRCGAPRGPHVDAVALDGGGYLVDGVPQAGLAPSTRGRPGDEVPHPESAR